MPKENDVTQEPFVRYNDEKKVDTFTTKLNEEERKVLEQMKQLLHQTKDSTAMKQLAWFGAKVLLGDSTQYLLRTVFKNKRKNQRLGIVDFD